MKTKRCLLAAAVLTGVLTSVRAGADADPLLTLLPRETDAFVFLDPDGFRTAVEGSTVLDSFLPGLDAFLARAGVATGDVRAAALALSGTGSVLVVRVSPQAALTPGAFPDPVPVERGVTLVDAGGDRPLSAAFLAEQHLAVGDREPVAAVIEVAAGRTRSAIANDALMALLDNADTGAPVWGACTDPSLLLGVLTGGTVPAGIATGASFHLRDAGGSVRAEASLRGMCEGRAGELGSLLARAFRIAGPPPEAASGKGSVVLRFSLSTPLVAAEAPEP